MPTPSFEQGSFLDNGGFPIVYAHQGGQDGGFPGNSLAAHQDAVSRGFRYSEMDGRATVNGELVAIHDHTLEDGTLVSSLKVADRKAAGLGLVDELFEELPPDQKISLDIKPDDSKWVQGLTPDHDDPGVELAVDLVKRHRAHGRVCIASFATKNLHELRQGLSDEESPDVVSTMSIEELAELAVASIVPGYETSIPIIGEVASVPEYQEGIEEAIVTPPFIEECHRRGKQVHVWTVNDPADMERFLDMGVDGFYTDELELAKGVMVARGQWAT